MAVYFAAMLCFLFREILLYFLPECDKSREHIASMCPEDVLSMFKVSEHLSYIKINVSTCMCQYHIVTGTLTQRHLFIQSNNGAE